MSNIEELGFNEPRQYDIEELIKLKDEQEVRKANAVVVNKFTGEVKPFRSMANPGNYHDASINTEESVTDTSEYEPLETTIERCSRSGFLREYMAKMEALDKQNAMDEDPNDFDFEPSPVETPGFDLSDAKALETELVNKLKDTPASKATESATKEELATTTTNSKEPSAAAE